MRLSMTQGDPFYVNFYEPKEGKINSFFKFRESEKTQKKTPGSTFFGVILVISKKG
jgi:hypothetical protein